MIYLCNRCAYMIYIAVIAACVISLALLQGERRCRLGLFSPATPHCAPPSPTSSSSPPPPFLLCEALPHQQLYCCRRFWPKEGKKWHEGVITDYDPSQGGHCITYNKDAKGEAWEWVNFE